LDRQSQPNREGVTAGSYTINCLLFADNLVLLGTPEQGFQHTLEQFTAACVQAVMKGSTKARGTMSLKNKTKKKQ